MTRESMQLRGIALLAGVMLLTSSCYVSRLALEHNSLMNSRKSVDAVISDPSTDQGTANRLRWTKDLLAFARTEGLNTDRSYNHFIKLNRNAISYLVQAAPADELTLKTWWFPIVGRVPYLGFFSAKERDSVAKELEDEGYDVAYGTVGAFSSLGWWQDPIYSTMLRQADTDLADLLFHELTHRTVWIPGSAEFNENLAEFVGDQLTLKYFIARGRRDDLAMHQRKSADRRLFASWLKEVRSELKAIYASDSLTRQEKISKKKLALAQAVAPSRLPRFESTAYRYVAKHPWNNASIMASSLYAPDHTEFERALSCSGAATMGKFLDILNDMVSESGIEPQVALTKMCAERTHVD